MKSLGFARALRARAGLIVVAALAGACLSVLAPPTPRTYTQPSTSLTDASSAAHLRYRATSLLGVPPISRTGGPEAQFATLAFYLKSAQISRSFAARLHYTGDDLSVIGRLISVQTDPKAATVAVNGFGGTRAQAADVTNAFVQTVQDYLAGLATVSSQQTLKDARAAVQSLKKRIDSLGQRIDELKNSGTTPSRTDSEVAVLQAQHDALIASYIAAYQRYSRLSAGTGPAVSLAVLQPAAPTNARPVPPSVIYKLSFRLVLGLLLGLGVGAALALLMEQYGRKVTSRQLAETLFASPVLAEIPKRRAGVVSGVEPAAAGPYRMLRAILLTASAQRGGGLLANGRVNRAAATIAGLAGDALAEGDPPPLAVSPSGADTGTVTLPSPAPRGHGQRIAERDSENASPAGNGSSGVDTRQIAVSSGNGRSNGRNGASESVRAVIPERPWVPERPLGPGAPVLVVAAPAYERSHPTVVANMAAVFAESGREVAVLRMGSAAFAHRSVAPVGTHERPRLDLHRTQVTGVRAADWTSGNAVATATDAVQDARLTADLVVVDVGPVASAEFAELGPLADGVVAVCELGSTMRADARHAGEIIDRSGARLEGVVLTAVPVRFTERLRSLRRRRSEAEARPSLGRSPA